ncbi:hypothetical protein BT93_C0673 [Corymbia citriodora subsp. variegata]|nr:hypothetical protein BT93_C0673 [Corymbia citriodora subsp. variegata]
MTSHNAHRFLSLIEAAKVCFSLHKSPTELLRGLYRIQKGLATTLLTNTCETTSPVYMSLPGVHTHPLACVPGRAVLVLRVGRLTARAPRELQPKGPRAHPAEPSLSVRLLGLWAPHPKQKCSFPSNKSCPHQSNSEWGQESYGLLAPLPSSLSPCPSRLCICPQHVHEMWGWAQ